MEPNKTSGTRPKATSDPMTDLQRYLREQAEYLTPNDRAVMIHWAEFVGQCGRSSSYQERAWRWAAECLGEPALRDLRQRCFRFLEEALELVQALDCSADDVRTLVKYVYGREVGHPPQEVGGVMLTLGVLCQSAGIDARREGELELERVRRPEVSERIRRKQATKPNASPLPGEIDWPAAADAAFRSAPEGARPKEAAAQQHPIDHPAYYGGEDNPYEAIKVIRAWLTREEFAGFLKGTALKYMCRAGRKEDGTEARDFGKAEWYVAAHVKELELRGEGSGDE